MQTLSPKKIILFALILVVAFFVYSYFFTGSAPTPLVTETPLLLQDNVKGRELLKVLLSLNNITLNEEIFSSPLFTALVDFSLALPEPGILGRPNPFAPIGSDASAGTVKTGTTPKPPAP